MSELPCIEVTTHGNPTASVIWLHGLGADGHDFEPIVPELQLPQNAAIRFVFPHSPSIPVTINGGALMPAWYDITSMTINRELDETQLRDSAHLVQKLIDREISRGIASNRIVLAGFSQGGAVGFEAALTYPKPLAGLMAMSTYFATAHSIEVHEANKSLPIEIYHGSQDPVVPEELGQRAYDTVKAMGHSANYTTYPMQHSVHPNQIRDISAWLQQKLL